MQNTERQDIYTRITAKIVASLEAGVRPWIKPWSGENATARITRPLRHNGTPYSGINILMLWGASVEHGFTSPSWMTFKQALELNPDSAIARVEYANGLVMLEGDKRMKEAEKLYAEAAECKPLDAMERLDVEMAKAELEDE